jgi:hypothetical protein
MRFDSNLAWSAGLLILVLFSACDDKTGTDKSAKSNGGAQAETGHSHGDGDELVWEVKEKLGDSKLDVWWGHHGNHFHGGDKIEPAVAILSDGKPFADAKVFNSIVDADDPTKVLVEEVSTVFEPQTPEEPAHYAQGELTIPSTATTCVIRFRVEIDGQSEHVRDVKVIIGH